MRPSKAGRYILAMATLAAALSCAALLMGQPNPGFTKLLSYNQPPPRAACTGAGRSVNACVAATASAGGVWIVFGRQPMEWSVMVHEACHRVQAFRGGVSQGPKAERECDAVQAGARACTHRR